MKKILIATAVTLMCSSAFAQTTTGPGNQTDMSKPGTSNSMDKDSMNKGTTGTSDTGTSKDSGMKKDSMSNDSMKKNEMKK